MSKNQRANFLKRRILWATALIAILSLCAVNFMIEEYKHADERYEAGVAKMKAALEAGTTDLLEPMGGIEHMHATVTSGQKMPIFGVCVDAGCPEIKAQWYLLVDKNQESGLQKKVEDAVLDRRGLAKWNVNAIVGVLGESEQPSPPPTGKEWLNISVWASAYKPTDTYQQ